MWKRKGKLLEAGAAAPDLLLRKAGGGEESLRGGRLLLAFFKISCPVCQYTLPYLNRVPRGVAVRGVSQNDEKDTLDFVRHYRLKFPILLDSEDDRFPASNGFGITYVPTLFLLEPEGRIGRVIEGWNRQEMIALGAVGEDENVPAWKAG